MMRMETTQELDSSSPEAAFALLMQAVSKKNKLHANIDRK